MPVFEILDYAGNIGIAGIKEMPRGTFETDDPSETHLHRIVGTGVIESARNAHQARAAHEPLVAPEPGPAHMAASRKKKVGQSH